MGMFDAVALGDFSGLDEAQRAQALRQAGLLQMGLGILGANQRGRPLGQVLSQGILGGMQNTAAMRQQAEQQAAQQRKMQQEAVQRDALSAMFGGADSKGIAWNGPRPGLMEGGAPTAQGMQMLGQAFPTQYAQQALERAFAAPAKDDLPTGMRKGPNGEWVYDPNYISGQKALAEARRSSTSVNVKNEGTIPPGYKAVRDKEGNILSLEPIQGGPAADKVKAEADAAASRAGQTKQVSDIVTTDVGRLRDKVKNSPVSGLFSLSAGVPGLPAHDAQALVDGIVANVGFDKLQQMRAASPTGGALGPVSDFENKLLQSVLGSIKLSQSKEQLLQNLDRVEAIYNRVIHQGIKPGDPLVDDVLRSNPVNGNIDQRLDRYR